MPKEFNLVAVAGAIGAGKTTLTQKLGRLLHLPLVFEDIVGNRYLKGFYADRKHFALQAQIEFLLHRSKQLAQLANEHNNGRTFIADYYFRKEEIFSQIALQEHEYQIYHPTYDKAAENVPEPDLVIYLKAKPDILMKRIRARNRDFEKGITLEYLKAVCQGYENLFNNFTYTKLYSFDVNTVDFEKDENAVRTIADVIKKEFSL